MNLKEGTCGYGVDGELGDEPAGPQLLKKKKNALNYMQHKNDSALSTTFESTIVPLIVWIQLK